MPTPWPCGIDGLPLPGWALTGPAPGHVTRLVTLVLILKADEVARLAALLATDNCFLLPQGAALPMLKILSPPDMVPMAEGWWRVAMEAEVMALPPVCDLPNLT